MLCKCCRVSNTGDVIICYYKFWLVWLVWLDATTKTTTTMLQWFPWRSLLSRLHFWRFWSSTLFLSAAFVAFWFLNSVSASFLPQESQELLRSLEPAPSPPSPAMAPAVPANSPMAGTPAPASPTQTLPPVPPPVSPTTEAGNQLTWNVGHYEFIG